MSDDQSGDGGKQQLAQSLPPDVLRAIEGDPSSLEGLATIAQLTMQGTSGPYPPPAMMAEYEKIDPAINKQILAEAKAQAAHRRSLEKLTTERSENRMDASQKNQQWVAMVCAGLGAAVILLPYAFGQEPNWPVSIAGALIAAFGVGGRPAATIFTAWIGSRSPSD